MHTEIFTAISVVSNPSSRHFVANQIREATIAIEDFVQSELPIEVLWHHAFFPTSMFIVQFDSRNLALNIAVTVPSQ